jgi:DNA invertase Pin-like site-specific DNA recombinase
MLIGYARVSKNEQHLDLQLDALNKAGCEQIYTDKITGSKEERKGLQEALSHLRKGDTLVVWRLDRLGRSLKHLIETLKGFHEKDIEFKSLTENIDTSTPTGMLMFHLIGALAEFERNLIRERTNAGLEAARARGHFGGRPKVGETETKRMARKLFEDKSNTIKDICKSLRISKATLYRYVNESKPVKKKIEGKDLVVEVLPK